MGFSALCVYEKIGIVILMMGCFTGFITGTLIPEIAAKHFLMYDLPHDDFFFAGLLGAMSGAMSIITFLGLLDVTKKTKKKWFKKLAIVRCFIATAFSITYFKHGDGFKAACLQWFICSYLTLFWGLAKKPKEEYRKL